MPHNLASVKMFIRTLSGLRKSAIVLAVLTLSTVHGTTYTVKDASEFNALPTLHAGDAVILLSGNYGAINKTIISSITDDSVAQTNPIHIYAETPGEVQVIAPSQINLQGSGIIFAGLHFTNRSGIPNNGSSNASWIIATKANSRYITVNNLQFDHCVSGDDYGHWILVRGFHHTIEYCSFEGKDEPNANATISFKRASSEPGISTPRNHILRYCYFGPREASESNNGYEAIRIGDSSSQAYDMRVTIEHNVFYRTIWRNDGRKPNELEIISNKSKGNIIRHNTFLESFGQITLRHGDACTVEGNFTFGSGYYANDSIELRSPNIYQSGIRVIGQNHIVQNNYFENLKGTGGRAALCLMAGYSNFNDGNGSSGDNTYEPADNALIANNTFINCREISLGYESGGTTQPTGVKIFNNVWQGSNSSKAIDRDSDFHLSASAGNYIYQPAGNYGWNGLSNSTYTDTNSPDISNTYDHYRIPSSSSPLIGAANNTHSVLKDIRSLDRPLAGQDIGCFQSGLSGEEFGPLFRNEVGPLFDHGPIGTYPVNAYGLDPTAAPSDNFDLSRWYLTLPVDTNGTFTGLAENVYPADLTDSYTNPPWFITGSDGAMTFKVPHNGAVRGSSPSPRNELRETWPNGSLRNWLPSDYGGSHTLDAVCTVNKLEDGVVIIGQIHGKEPNIPTVILRYDKRNGTTRIYATVKKSPDDPITQDTLEYTSVPLGSPIHYQLKMLGSKNSLIISCTVNGLTKSIDMYANSPDWVNATQYFKAGAYYTNPPTNTSTEVAFYKLQVTHSSTGNRDPLVPVNVTASDHDGNVPQNTLDNDLGTRWSAQGDGQWIQYDMGEIVAIHELQIAWYKGNERFTTFDVQISDDASNWRTIGSALTASMLILELDAVSIPVSHGRYLRIVGHGNTNNQWNSITEVSINGTAVPPIAANELFAPIIGIPGNSMRLDFNSVYGRRYQAQHTPTLSPADWKDIGPLEIGTGGSITLENLDTTAAKQGFYRIRITP